ncbi:MAG: hypothetical protein ACWA5L_10800 [bacterium]
MKFIFTIIIALTSAFIPAGAFAQETRPEIIKNDEPKKLGIDPSHPSNSKGPHTRCFLPDLIVSEDIALAALEIAPQSNTATIKISSKISNDTNCNAKSSRAKAILSLSGGKWIAQDGRDIIVTAHSDFLTTFELSFLYNDLLTDECTLEHEWSVDIIADFREEISESDESNNSYTHVFTTNSNKLCAQ